MSKSIGTTIIKTIPEVLPYIATGIGIGSVIALNKDKTLLQNHDSQLRQIQAQLPKVKPSLLAFDQYNKQ